VTLRKEGTVRPRIAAPACLTLGVALALALAAGPAAGKRGDVRVAGSCTGASTSKLKLSEEDGRIEVEFEVDQNRNGARWIVVLRHDGARFARLARTTRPPSGSFEARVLVQNAPRADGFSARATSPSGEACTARATFA
jgi:hypothetical protein